MRDRSGWFLVMCLDRKGTPTHMVPCETAHQARIQSEWMRAHQKPARILVVPCPAWYWRLAEND